MRSIQNHQNFSNRTMDFFLNPGFSCPQPKTNCNLRTLKVEISFWAIYHFIKSGVRFLILFVLVDAILLSLDLKKSPSYDFKNFDDFEYSSLRRFQKYLVCECSLIFWLILKLNHSVYELWCFSYKAK
jgi:hypothetical protein